MTMPIKLKQFAQDGATNGQVITWNSPQWGPQTPSGGSGTYEILIKDPNFGNITGTISADLLYPTFSGDFDSLYQVSSASASARLDAAFSGRLISGQTSITRVSIFIKGTSGSQYRLKVYAEGSGATPVYDSGLTSTPTSLTELVVTTFSAQPTGSGRYFVVVENYLDTSETNSFSSPLVRQA
jgi:hypothetical protein